MITRTLYFSLVRSISQHPTSCPQTSYTFHLFLLRIAFFNDESPPCKERRDFSSSHRTTRSILVEIIIMLFTQRLKIFQQFLFHIIALRSERCLICVVFETRSLRNASTDSRSGIYRHLHKLLCRCNQHGIMLFLDFSTNSLFSHPSPSLSLSKFFDETKMKRRWSINLKKF